MKKKKKKVAVVNPTRHEKKGSEPQNPSNYSNEDAPGFDFGGLPDRDLKKNLGCG